MGESNPHQPKPFTCFPLSHAPSTGRTPILRTSFAVFTPLSGSFSSFICSFFPTRRPPPPGSSWGRLLSVHLVLAVWVPPTSSRRLLCRSPCSGCADFPRCKKPPPDVSRRPRAKEHFARPIRVQFASQPGITLSKRTHSRLFKDLFLASSDNAPPLNGGYMWGRIPPGA